ncbi:MAG: hypothetical protein QM677_02525 [Microbacterium sp.]
MSRTGDPRPDLRMLRLGIGLSAQEAARRLGVTDLALVNYEAKGYGSDRVFDQTIIDSYLAYALAAYASDALYGVHYREEAA